MKRLIEKNKNNLRQVRHARVRARVMGTSSMPRVSVWRGLKSIQAQLIDDSEGKTLLAAGSQDIKKTADSSRSRKVGIAFAVGKMLADKALAKGITKVVFDRGGYHYHGRIAALAEGARDGGLQF